MNPRPTGHLVEGTPGAIAFERTFSASVDDVWAAITEPDRTARWIGRWTGDPTTGRVDLQWSAEEGCPTESVTITSCDPPRFLSLQTGAGPDAWQLELHIRPEGSRSELRLTQTATDPRTLDDIGPGWDYYLDRLVAAETGGNPDELSFEPDYYPNLARTTGRSPPR